MLNLDAMLLEQELQTASKAYIFVDENDLCVELDTSVVHGISYFNRVCPRGAYPMPKEKNEHKNNVIR